MPWRPKSKSPPFSPNVWKAKAKVYCQLVLAVWYPPYDYITCYINDKKIYNKKKENHASEMSF